MYREDIVTGFGKHWKIFVWYSFRRNLSLNTQLNTTWCICHAFSTKMNFAEELGCKNLQNISWCNIEQYFTLNPNIMFTSSTFCIHIAYELYIYIYMVSDSSKYNVDKLSILCTHHLWIIYTWLMIHPNIMLPSSAFCVHITYELYIYIYMVSDSSKYNVAKLSILRTHHLWIIYTWLVIYPNIMLTSSAFFVHITCGL